MVARCILLLAAQAGMVAGACLGWCARKPNADATKCTWNACKDCAFCTGEGSHCPRWCIRNPKPSKCTWDSCKSCAFCEGEVSRCPHWCMRNPKPTKCTWDSCKYCAFCTVISTTSLLNLPTTTRTYTGRIRLEGRQLIVNGMPLHLKGVNWQPVPKGLPVADETGLRIDWVGGVNRDVANMKFAGVNAVRTYQPLTNVAVLDKLYENGIYVFNGIYNNYVHDNIDELADKVNSVKDHPAILMWVIGNEFNFNFLYTRNKPAKLSMQTTINTIAEVCQRIKAVDSIHPIATVFLGPYDNSRLYGLTKISSLIARFNGVIDAWGFNVYSWDRIPAAVFDGFVEEHPGVPFFIGEYGTDSYNAYTNQVDEAAQAHAVVKLTADIAAKSSAIGGSCMGGFIMEWNDEWWKTGNPNEHDLGTSPNGVYPDNLAHEEWFGIVDVYGVPKMALEALKNVPIPGSPGLSTSASSASVVPTTSVVPTSPADANCAAHPRCAHLWGDCCPTSQGMRLGCCEPQRRLRRASNKAFLV